jgi:hypothetical protein
MLNRIAFTRRSGLAGAAAFGTGLVLSPRDWLSAFAQGAKRKHENPQVLELRRLEARAEKLGAQPRAMQPRTAQAPEPEPDAFRNMKARALDLLDQLSDLEGPQPRAALIDADAFLRQIHRDERSVPSAMERSAAARPPFDDKIKAEYRSLYDGCAVKSKYKSAVQADMERVPKNRPRYDSVQGAQPPPKDTTPTRTGPSGVLHTSGPPLSPWQESTPPSRYPAHSCPSLIRPL